MGLSKKEVSATDKEGWDGAEVAQSRVPESEQEEGGCSRGGTGGKPNVGVSSQVE